MWNQKGLNDMTLLKRLIDAKGAHVPNLANITPSIINVMQRTFINKESFSFLELNLIIWEIWTSILIKMYIQGVYCAIHFRSRVARRD